MELIDCTTFITFASELDDTRPVEKPRLPERPNIPWVLQEEGDA